MTTSTKTIKLVTITHKIYSYDCNTDPSYDKALDNLFATAARIVDELREKYKQYSFAKDITTWSRGDQDDDRFDYVYLKVPEADTTSVRNRLHYATGEGGYRWSLSIDAAVSDPKDVQYTMHSKSLTPGKLWVMNHPDFDSIQISGVDTYHYAYKAQKNRSGQTVVDYTKDCIINHSGLSTKLLASLSRYKFDTTIVKSALPKDAVKASSGNWICVELNEKNRANLMRIAREKPSTIHLCLHIWANGYRTSVSDKMKSEIIKAYYSLKDKEAK